MNTLLSIFGKKKSSSTKSDISNFTNKCYYIDVKEEVPEINNKALMWQIDRFLHLTKMDSVIRQFLEFDCCNKHADKYLLAMVFVYFVRAKLTSTEYNRKNFFCALHLAHDIEEDDDRFKYQVMKWGLGISTMVGQEQQFLKLRDQLWQRMDFRAMVSLKCCLEVMNWKPNSILWERNRNPVHAYDDDDLAICPNCMDGEEENFYNTDLESSVDSGSETSDSSDYSPATKRSRTEE